MSFNSNLPPEDQNQHNEQDQFDFESFLEIPKENIFIFSGEPVDMTINIGSTSINTLDPKRAALKLYSILKSSLDQQTWNEFATQIITDPEILGKLLRGTK